MAVGDIGKRFREARLEMRPRLTQTQVAEMLGVSQGRLGNWERGQHDPPAEVIIKALTVLKKPLSFFYGDSIPALAKEQTSVYYGDVEPVDKGPGYDTVDLIGSISDPRTFRVMVPVVDGAAVWSLKSAQRTPLNISAFLAAGHTPVKLKDQHPSLDFERGTVLVFQPDDYPHPDTYLLLQSVADPDLRAIRYIDPMEDPKALLSDDKTVPALRLGQWVPIGFCYAEIQGASTPSPRIVIRPNGIGPRRR